MRWTVPSAGNISNLIMTIWCTHSAAGVRSNDFPLLDSNTTLTSGTVSSTSFFNRTMRTFTRMRLLSGDGRCDRFGDSKSAQQSFGSLDGMTLHLLRGDHYDRKLT
jgi:hypothetical protein